LRPPLSLTKGQPKDQARARWLAKDGGKTVLKVLIADDSALVRERLAAMVSDLEGVEIVGQATNAPEAMEIIERLNPDVVILDIRMPGGNGIQVLETIKASGTGSVVIMLTAFPYPQYRQKCLEAGADYFFDKATEFDRVIPVIEQLAGPSRCSGHSNGEQDT
jgi:DNA-binding NarL/FixJ family response regulator